MRIAHAFQSAIADDPAATAAGEVTPTRWNADHEVEFDAVTYTTTGTLDVEPFIVLGAPTPAQVSGALIGEGGVWAESISVSAVNTALTAISYTNLIGLIAAYSVSGSSSLTSISFPELTNVGGFNGGTAGLTTLSLPALRYMSGAYSVTGASTLTSISMPVLESMASFSAATLAAVTSISLPMLTTISGQFAPSTMAALTSIDVTSLEVITTTLAPTTLGALTTFSAPALWIIGGAASFASMGALTSISMPVIERIGVTVTTGNAFAMTTATAAVTSIDWGSSLKRVGGTAGNVVITSAALTQTSVDHILVRLAALDGTNGTTAFSNRTVTITGTSATPSATGLAAKATLVARGCTVTNN